MTLPLQFHTLSFANGYSNGYSFTSCLPILPLIQIPLSFSISCTKINRNNYHSLPFRFPPTQKNSRRGNGGSSVAVCYSAIRAETLQWGIDACQGNCNLEIFSCPSVHSKHQQVSSHGSRVNMVVGVLSWHSWFISFTTFLAGELELPFLALLLVIVAPYQAMNLRGTQAGAIISLARAGFLALQHFSRVGSLQQAFDQRSVVATLSVICITVVPCLLLF